MPAGAHRLGARLPAAARCVSARALSSRARACRLHAGCREGAAHFSDGEKIEADLLVGADGIALDRATASAPEVVPLYAGYSAWRALIAEERFSARRASRPVRIHDLHAAAGRAVPRLSGGRAGQRSASRPSPLQRRVVPAGGREDEIAMAAHRRAAASTHAISIPPPLIRREAIAEMRADAERLLGPQFRQIVRLIDEPILQPIYDLESPQMAFGRVAIVGDAAFVARPHVAAGVSKAADDAAALVEALRREADVARGAQALRGGAAAREYPHHRARAPSRRLSAGDAHRGGAGARRPALDRRAR